MGSIWHIVRIPKQEQYSRLNYKIGNHTSMGDVHWESSLLYVPLPWWVGPCHRYFIQFSFCSTYATGVLSLQST